MEKWFRALRALVALVLVAVVTAVPVQASAQGPAPAEVPPATGDNAVITVQVGSDRVGTAGVSPLAGVTLQLYDGGGSGPSTPVGEDWATCVSDADGDCSFVVPDTETGRFGCTGGAGDNCDRRFWVVQTGAPTGYTQNTQLRTGRGDGTSSQLTPYTFRTGSTLRAGETYTSQTDFMVGTGTTNRVASGGIWQQSRVNPAPLQQCGLEVALVLDLSGSVTSSQLADLKAASDLFVDSLVGTPSEVALFSFSTVTPAEGATQNYPGADSVSTQAGADEVKARYADWTSGGGTNWDRGLAATAESNESYDIVIVITDGDPTYYSDPQQGPGSYNRLRETENGIFSANAVKAAGSRVLAVGVGAGVADASTSRNLAAISGPTAYDGSNAGEADYFQVSDYGVVGDALRDLALGDCTGSLSVVKQIVGPDGDVDSATSGGADWTFDVESSTTGVTLEQSSGTTDATGAVNFPLTFAGGTTSGTIDVTEQARAGYTPFAVDGANAICTDLATGDSIDVTNGDDGAFSVDVASTEAVSCIVYNQTAAPATVTVDKEWVIDGADPVPQGGQPPGFTSRLTLTGPGDAGATEQPWRVTRGAYTAGEDVTIDEQITLESPAVDADLCEIGTPQIVEINGAQVTPVDVPTGGYTATLVEDANTFTIRNTVDCQSRLTLVKNVEGGTASPTEWDLAAIPGPDAPDGQLPGFSGQAGSTAVTDQPISPELSYQLAESGGPATYVQDDQRSDLEDFPASTGSWSCGRVDAAGDPLPGFADGLNGGVVAPIAARVVCTATNRTGELQLAKTVTNDDGGTAVPGDFTLSAIPGEGVEGLTTTEVPGTTPEQAESFEVRPDHPYTFDETGPDGYTLTEVLCGLPGETPEPVTEISVPAGQNVQCIFVNDDEPALLTLRKLVAAGETGATQTPADWTLTATPQDVEGQDPVSGDGEDGVTGVEVSAGSYALSESEVDGFAAGSFTCADDSGATVVVSDGVVDLVNGADVTCTVVNTAIGSTLTLVKQVVNDDGGTAQEADWTLTATGPTTGVTGATGDEAVTGAPVAVGQYVLSEDGPDGYTALDWSCLDDGTAVPVEDSTVTIGLAQTIECTVVNDDDPALLTLRKVVAAGETGATQTPADWTLTATPQGVEGQDPVSGDGEDGVSEVPVIAGSYALSESEVDGFAAGSFTCADDSGATVVVSDGVVDLVNGADVTCTVVNTAIGSTLTLVKQVVNDDGGTAQEADWTLTATGPTTGVTGATGDEAVTGAPVAVGQYVLSEDGPDGYTALDWSCLDDGTAVPVEDSTVTIGLAQTIECTIVNDDDAPVLTLVKRVINDEGGTATPQDWTLSAAGPQDLSGTSGSSDVTEVTVPTGTYSLAEADGPTEYRSAGWECEDRGESLPILEGDAVELAAGAQVVCTVTNLDTGPPVRSASWQLTKASDPPTGELVQPGQVVTYTVVAQIVTGTSVESVVVVDDLTDVLDDATFVEGSIDSSIGSATLSGTTLTWDIGTLTDVQTLTYQVRVADEVDGDSLVNVATGQGDDPCLEPNGEQAVTPLALEAAAAQACEVSTEHPTQPSVLPPTPSPEPSYGPTPDDDLATSGTDAGLIVVWALSLLVAGTAITYAVRRRRGRDV